MKFTCTQENLLSGLTSPAGVATKGGTLPILQNVRLETVNGALIVSATNLEIGVTCTVRGKVEEDGAMSVEARLLLDYVRLLPNSKVHLRAENGKLHIASENGEEAELQGVGVEEFPLIPKVTEEKAVVCRSRELRDALEKTIFAASSDEARPEIHGVYLRTIGTEVVLAATDSFRLSERRCVAVRGECPDGTIIPLRAAAEMLKILPLTEEEVRLVCGSTQIALQIPNTELVSRVVEGTFPDYAQIVPTQFTTTAQAPQQQMMQTLKRAAVFSQGEGGELQMEMKPQEGKLRIRANNQRLGSQHSDLTITGQGPDLTVAFNVRFVVEGLGSFSEEVQWFFVDVDSPAVLRGKTPTEGMYLLMPIRN